MRQSVQYAKFTEEQIREANRKDILQLAQEYGYEPEAKGQKKAIHMKHSGGLYVFPESNHFFQFTSGQDGEKGGPIDFVMREDSIGFRDAVAKLLGTTLPVVSERKPYEKEEKGPLVLPDKAQNFKRVFWYLLSVRGLDKEIVSYFMNLKMIYQEAKYGNCVFVGYDQDGTAKYCSMRAARENSSFKMDAVNSDKSYPFFHEGVSDMLIVNECPIDMLSHATLSKVYHGIDWKRDHRISMGCLWDGALDRYLQSHPAIKRIVIAVDDDYLARDKAGKLTNWGQIAAQRMRQKYLAKGYDCAIQLPHLNDFNQDLTEMRKGRTVEDLDRQKIAELQAEFEKDAVAEPENDPDGEMEV